MKKVFSEEDLMKNLSLYHLNRHLKKKPMQRYHQQIDNSNLHEREKYRKKLEILLLNSFLHHFPEIQFENLTCESPDFIATFHQKKIGIELTEVINHLEIKKMECFLNKIFREAELLLEEENLEEFKGVYFLEFKDFKDVDFQLQYETILRDIQKSIKMRKPYGKVKRIRKSMHRRNVFITFDFTLNLFDELHSEKIIEIIQKKNEKYPYYDATVDECWLVIVSDMNSIASRYTFIQNQEDLKMVKTPFHKIFHLDNLCGSLTNIK